MNAFVENKKRLRIFVAFVPLAIAACSNSKPTITPALTSSAASESQVNSPNAIGVPEKRPAVTLLSQVIASNEVQNTGSAGQNFAPANRPEPTSSIISNQTKFSSKAYGVAGSPRVATGVAVRKGGGRYQVGKPYTIRGVRYVPKEDPSYKATGLASWYGPNFHGRLTANGEVYDQFALSAAHPTMPLPSYAKVTNLENGASVTVRVNDRGPFSKGRIIDLSSRAAQLLGYTKKGVANVRVEYVGKAKLDGLDEQQLLATYHPGNLKTNTLLASASSVNRLTTRSSNAVSAISEATTTRRTLDAFDEGRFGFESTALSETARPASLINGYIDHKPQQKAVDKIRNQFDVGGLKVPEEGMAQLQRLSVGPVSSKYDLFTLSERLSDFGPVSISQDKKDEKFYLALTVISQDVERIRALLK